METAKTITPAIIVGGGRLGMALQGMGDGRDVLVRRGQHVPVEFDGPIFVCTRNDDLDAVLEATHSSRWSDLVFFQNGMLDPWFESRGLRDANQVLAYFAVSKLGEPPVDGITDTNPEGLTAAFGKWASAVAARLHSGGLSCKVLEKEHFDKQMLEKLIWISAFMLVGGRHPGATVGVVENNFRSEVTNLIGELRYAAVIERGVAFDQGMEVRLCAYARAVAHFPTAVKEAIFSMILTSTRDPRIVNRNESSPLENIASGSRVSSRRVIIEGIEMKIRYCKVCKIFRAP